MSAPEYNYSHGHPDTESDRERCVACNPPSRVLGVNEPDAVITGQIQAHGGWGNLPVSGNRCCPGEGSMAHVRGCVNHPESESD